MLSLSSRRASAMTWQSFGSGPPPDGVKQVVAPENKRKNNFKIRKQSVVENLQGAPQTFVELVCRCSSSSRRWYKLGQKTDFTSTFLALPIQVEAKVTAPSQTFVSKNNEKRLYGISKLTGNSLRS